MTMTVEPEASAGTPSATTPRSWAFLAGVIGAAAALSIGELFDNLSDSVTSLVIAVGEVIIDITPDSDDD